MAGVKCPRCGLFSPDSAQRCDCGYDFETKAVQEAYFKQKLPSAIETYFMFVVAVNVVGGVIAIVAFHDLVHMISAGVWSVVIWWLYSQMVAKKNWARLWLVVLTFPVGLFLGLSREARMYCLQK